MVGFPKFGHIRMVCTYTYHLERSSSVIQSFSSSKSNYVLISLIPLGPITTETQWLYIIMATMYICICIILLNANAYKQVCVCNGVSYILKLHVTALSCLHIQAIIDNITHKYFIKSNIIYCCMAKTT